MTISTKLCRKCRHCKPLSDFYVAPYRKGGYATRCKECMRAEEAERSRRRAAGTAPPVRPPRREPLTAERLREVVSYDPETGLFAHLRSLGAADVGDAGGTVSEAGYMLMKVDGRKYRLNRLAWLYMTGAWPLGVVDHKNRNKADNRWDNLRDISHAANLQNRDVPSARSSSGLIGAHRVPGREQWTSCIMVDGKVHHLGRFDTAEEASAAYMAAKARLHPAWLPAGAA